jgi:hypothetical protein
VRRSWQKKAIPKIVPRAAKSLGTEALEGPDAGGMHCKEISKERSPGDDAPWGSFDLRENVSSTPEASTGRGMRLMSEIASRRDNVAIIRW